MSRSRKLLCALLGLGLILPLAPLVMAQAPAAASQESVLEYIPADAWAAVVIRDLKGLNDKIVGVGQELGLPIGPGTMVGDPLTMLKGMLGAGEGLNDKGSVALVLLKTEELNAEGLSKNVVLLVPCIDPKAFLEQFATSGTSEAVEKPAVKEKDGDEKEQTPGAATPKKAEGTSETKAADSAELPKGVVKLSLMGKPSFGAAKGKFAVLAPEPTAIKSFLQAKGTMRSVLSPDRLAMVDKKLDFFVWLNVAGAGPSLKETIKSSLMGIMLMASMSDPTLANQVQPWIQNIEKFLDQTASLQLGLVVAKTGFDLDLYMQVKPDTDMAKSIASRRVSEDSLLTSLPAEKFILAVGGTSNTKAEDIKQGMDTLNGLLDRAEVKKACDPEKLAEFKKALNQIMELSVGGEAGALSVSRLPEGDGGMIGVIFVGQMPKGAKKWLDSVRTLVPAGLGMVTDEEVRKIFDAIVYKPDAEKIDGVQCDTLSLDLTKIGKLDESDIAAVKKIVGSEGAVARLAALDDDHVGIFFGGGAKRVAQVIALAKKGEAPLAADPSLKAIAPYLPKGKRFFEMYVAVDTLLNLVNDAAIAAGEKSKPIAGEIPDINAPLAIIGTVGKDSQQINIYVPMKLVKSVKDIATSSMAEKMMPTEPAEPQAEPERKPSPPDESGLK